VLATNRGITTIRGTSYKSPHGIPVDLLDRLLIIATKAYSDAELTKILEIRAEEEDVELTNDAKELLTAIGAETSLRYAIHMITVAHMVALRRKATEIDVEDVRKVYDLFVDVKRSTEFLHAYQQEFLFSDEKPAPAVAAVAGGAAAASGAPVDKMQE
jgi:RuvB-like protein 2